MYVAFCMPVSLYFLISFILLARTCKCCSSLPESAESAWVRRAGADVWIFCSIQLISVVPIKAF